MNHTPGATACAALLFSLLAAPLAAQEKSDPNRAKFNALAESDTMIMVPMRDGVRLATDVYLPKGDGPFPVVFVKTPYNFNKIAGASLMAGVEAIERGYALVVQNERGRYYSEGDWEILGRPQTDGYDSLTWLAEQPWSNGKVGTWGCSSTAEWQLALAAQDHPAHAAMAPMASGAGIGRVGEFYEQGNWYKGGVHQTLFTVWLYGVQQNTRPQFPKDLTQAQRQRLRKSYDLAAEMPEMDWAKHMQKLPAIDWLKEAGANEGPGAELMVRKPNDPAWYSGGLYHDNEDFSVPAFWFNSWFDVSQGPNLALYQHVRENATEPAVRDGQYMMVAPTLHCGFYRTPEYEDYIAGDLNVGNAYHDYWESIFSFFDYYLKDEDNGFYEKTPRVQFYTMGRNEWQSADAWPPADAEPVTMYLTSDGGANSVFGDGILSAEPPMDAGADTYTYDPMNPVPALGGGVCCNRGAALGGSFDQRGIEARADVLVYTSPPLESDLEVTGSVRTKLFVSSDARDTDFTVKLVDVHPDGTAWNVDDTILRARYRDGYEQEVFMEDGQVYELNPTPMSTSYEFKAGHRIRVEVSSSKFPQYMRNLNTGGNNYDETESVVARNTVHHSVQYPSQVILFVREGNSDTIE
ncbi:cocaine esterase [Luminiphilus syltensis NOR5-1B]|uniref:Cocaine esterase n=1 Tax=Luminiphilus syltensis NOR5-1B TaxID=565045 RepID=B8KXZ1_9GAMM|nr:CocE/NonD family hydrolase [Luminiphilus syltensis]EED35870.1 cocaine esterase [Luminiphilus syltensis NOR5-1B]